jgi:hypothetical protein
MFGMEKDPYGGCTVGRICVSGGGGDGAVVIGRIVIDTAAGVNEDCCDALPWVDGDGAAEDVGSVDAIDVVVRMLIGGDVDAVRGWEFVVMVDDGKSGPPGTLWVGGADEIC